MKHDGDSDTNRNWCTMNDPQYLVKELDKLEIEGGAGTI